MNTTLIANIKQLAGIRNNTAPLRGKELAELPSIKNAYLIIEDDEIAGYGPMNELKKWPSTVYDATDKMVLPGWCDSHTHLVYAGSRENEFVDKIRGLSYAEIAAKGGGILNSARKLAETSKDQLFNDAWQRLQQAAKMGTTSIEIKSGYGLSLDSELKMLRVIKRLKEKSDINIKATFLGAHTYPKEFTDNHQGYIDVIIKDMLPAIASERLADYIDVFCETGFFSPQETEAICKAGMAYGLKPKIHANQLNASGGVQTGVKINAVSVDHLETMDDDAVSSLKNSSTIGTLLPSAAFFLRMPYQPARRLIDDNCAIALASDCNPGSSPGFNMNFIVSLGCIGMKMLPEESLNAATFNGACAMELQHITGSIATGKRADLIITHPIPSIGYIPYSFSTNHVCETIIKGKFI